MPSDPHSFSDTSQGRIVRLDLRIRPNFALRTLGLQVHYTLDRPVDGSFFLDMRDLHPERICAPAADLAWSIDREDAILGQRLHLQELNGVQEFSIEVTTDPGARALQWLEPEQTAGGVHPFLYSQCQAIQARSLLPCQDSPSVRFTFTAEVEAPAPLSAVMAAAPDGVRQQPGSRVYRFRMPQPIPSYLLALAVGHLDFRSLGPRTGLHAEPEVLDAAAWEFADNEARLIEAEKLFGPYLWDRYDVLVMPPLFPYGGMENPRLTFLNGAYVAGDRSGVWLIAHELAHAWTGNLVTNATWEDFWLNEGATTYAEGRISEATEGIESTRLRVAGRVGRLLREIERLGPGSPMTRLRMPLAGKDPNESYGDIAYYKGLLLFLRLEQAAGRPAFDSFLRRYIDAFRFRSISSEEFLQCLEDWIPEAARAIDARRWIYEPGLPQGAEEVSSSLRDDVLDVTEAYRRGERPSAQRVAGWTRLQQVVFLTGLLPRIPVSDCAYFEGLFGLRQTRDGDLLCRFSELAVRSGYREALPAYEEFFASVGRYSFHQPAFRALAEETWSRPMARSIFERWRRRHHPATVAAIEKILSQAGV